MDNERSGALRRMLEDALRASVERSITGFLAMRKEVAGIPTSDDEQEFLKHPPLMRIQIQAGEDATQDSLLTSIECLNKGVYGHCAVCRGEIAQAALEANPLARLCAACSAQPDRLQA